MSLSRFWPQRLLAASRDEQRAAFWSFTYFFALLASYYVMRPLRDQMGIAGGVKNLSWMFTATFAAVILAQPIYGAAVARLPRGRLIPLVYHFCVANLLLFWLLLRLEIAPVVVARVFFVWLSVFALFGVAVFWSFMADLFEAEQGKRLFGFIGAGGTLGSLLGPAITLGLSEPLGPINLLIAAAVLLEVAVFCVRRLEKVAQSQKSTTSMTGDNKPVGGTAFAGLTELARSPYLFGIGLWVSLLSFGATILYFEQAHLVSENVRGAAAQTRYFASLDLTVNLLTLATQVLATGPLIARFGTGVAAAALPAAYVIGFATLFVSPTLTVVLVLQIVQRWMNFAVANPARQVLYTVIGREEKYKAKNLIDVVIYRGSDALYGWVFETLQTLGLKIGGIALCALPVTLGWLALSMALGREEERRAASGEHTAARGQARVS